MGERTSFFTVDRKLLEDELWTSEPFTKGQAWLDLIGRASYKDTDELKRGEIITTERELAARWHWNNSKVHRFLGWLEGEGMIAWSREWSAERSRKWSRIRLEKYGVYQGSRSADWSAEWSAERNTTYYINNINNIKTNINMPDGMMEELQKIFGDRTGPLVETIRTYYSNHPEKTFPGWKEAALQFNANQERWRSGKSADPMARAIASFMEEAK